MTWAEVVRNGIPIRETMKALYKYPVMNGDDDCVGWDVICVYPLDNGDDLDLWKVVWAFTEAVWDDCVDENFDAPNGASSDVSMALLVASELAAFETRERAEEFALMIAEKVYGDPLEAVDEELLERLVVLPCLRERVRIHPRDGQVWNCVNDHTGCLWNDGHNGCSHPGKSLSPLEEGS